jgi:SAM-dependent methyltransferase
MAVKQQTAADVTLPEEPAAIDYVERWRQLVDRRRVQMEAANREAGIEAADYWARRAGRYRDALHARMDEDPLFLRLRSVVTPASTVIDVGAGTGRHTLALAPFVRRVTAVDPSEAMLGFLRRDAEAAKLDNVETVLSGWMEAEVAPADFVICSHVVYPIVDVVPFVRKLEAAAKERVFVFLRADPLPTDMGLWRYFRGVDLTRQPTHDDLLNVLWQIGVFCDVEIVEQRFTFSYETLDDAVAAMRHALSLREGDAAAEAKLRGLLEERLRRREDGRLAPEASSARSAILSWAPVHAG